MSMNRVVLRIERPQQRRLADAGRTEDKIFAPRVIGDPCVGGDDRVVMVALAFLCSAGYMAFVTTHVALEFGRRGRG